jgi:folate-dependent phosphoribosylglycinamide formyltransferase PurN
MAPLFRVAVLTSSTAPGIESLRDDPNRGLIYELADVVTRKHAPRNLHEREAFDEETVALLRDAGADWVILDDYHYIVTPALLRAFPDRILALHDGDLTLRDNDGARRYAMLHAVRRAIFAGETETRPSLFFVTERFGEGPLMLVGAPYPISGIAADAIRRGEYEVAIEYARVHRDWMMRSAYGTMLVRALQFLAAGTIKVAGDIAWIDGAPGPCRLGDAPAVCHELGAAIQRGIPASCPFIQS